MGQEDSTEDPGSWSTPGAHGTDGFRKRGTASSAKKEKSTQSQSAKDDSDAIKNIRQCKNYYEILGVAQDCSEDDLKKAYKKLALKYHPDKNHTPGATEAFKAISNAFSVLNDPAKRSRYDQYGTEEEQALTRGRHSYEEYDYTRGFEGDISAEELFNMFFGSGFQMGGPRVRTYYARPRTQYRYHRQYQQPYAAAPDDEGIGLHRLLPLLIIIVIMMLTNLLRTDPTFSLQQTSKYNTERRTSNLGIAYYVKPDFTETFKGSTGNLEAQVEDEYITNLRSSCYKERMYKESLMWQARNYRNSRMYEQAQNTATPSCDTLQDIYGG